MSDHSLIEEYGSLHSIEEYLRGLIDQGLLDKEGKEKNRYIRSSDFNTVLKGSDAVLQVIPEREDRKNPEKINQCRIIEQELSAGLIPV